MRAFLVVSLLLHLLLLSALNIPWQRDDFQAIQTRHVPLRLWLNLPAISTAPAAMASIAPAPARARASARRSPAFTHRRAAAKRQASATSQPVAASATRSLVSQPAVAVSAADNENQPVLDIQAAFLDNPLPPYPPLLREQGISGTVWLRVLVDQAGRAEVVEVAQSSGYRLMDQAATEAVRRWRFRAARHQARARPEWVKFPLRFALNEDS